MVTNLEASINVMINTLQEKCDGLITIDDLLPTFIMYHNNITVLEA